MTGDVLAGVTKGDDRSVVCLIPLAGLDMKSLTLKHGRVRVRRTYRRNKKNHLVSLDLETSCKYCLSACSFMMEITHHMYGETVLHIDSLCCHSHGDHSTLEGQVNLGIIQILITFQPSRSISLLLFYLRGIPLPRPLIALCAAPGGSCWPGA